MALVSDMSAEEIDGLKRGGHDFRKLFAAFQAAKSAKGPPDLCKDKEGFGMGGAGESLDDRSPGRSRDVRALLAFRDHFALPLSDEQVRTLPLPADRGQR